WGQAARPIATVGGSCNGLGGKNGASLLRGRPGARDLRREAAGGGAAVGDDGLRASGGDLDLETAGVHVRAHVTGDGPLAGVRDVNEVVVAHTETRLGAVGHAGRRLG